MRRRWVEFARRAWRVCLCFAVATAVVAALFASFGTPWDEALGTLVWCSASLGVAFGLLGGVGRQEVHD